MPVLAQSGRAGASLCRPGRQGRPRRPGRWQQQKPGPRPPDRQRTSKPLPRRGESAGPCQCWHRVAEPEPRSAGLGARAGLAARAGGSSRSQAPARRIATGQACLCRGVRSRQGHASAGTEWQSRSLALQAWAPGPASPPGPVAAAEARPPPAGSPPDKHASAAAWGVGRAMPVLAQSGRAGASLCRPGRQGRPPPPGPVAAAEARPPPAGSPPDKQASAAAWGVGRAMPVLAQSGRAGASLCRPGRQGRPRRPGRWQQQKPGHRAAGPKTDKQGPGPAWQAGRAFGVHCWSQLKEFLRVAELPPDKQSLPRPDKMHSFCPALQAPLLVCCVDLVKELPCTDLKRIRLNDCRKSLRLHHSCCAVEVRASLN